MGYNLEDTEVEFGVEVFTTYPVASATTADEACAHLFNNTGHHYTCERIHRHEWLISNPNLPPEDDFIFISLMYIVSLAFSKCILLSNIKGFKSLRLCSSIGWSNNSITSKTDCAPPLRFVTPV